MDVREVGELEWRADKEKQANNHAALRCTAVHPTLADTAHRLDSLSAHTPPAQRTCTISLMSWSPPGPTRLPAMK